MRVAPVLTVMLARLGIVPFSMMLVKADSLPKWGWPPYWRRYISFVFTARSMSDRVDDSGLAADQRTRWADAFLPVAEGRGSPTSVRPSTTAG